MLLATLAGLLAAAQPLSAAMSKVDITPPVPLPLGGYTERGGALSEPGGDRLYSRTLLFKQGDLKIALVSAEMLTIPESLVREVRVRIPSDVHLFLAATHTHCAPDSQMLNDRMTFAVPGIAKFDRKWLDWYAARIADGIEVAMKLKPSPVDRPSVLIGHLDQNRPRRPGALPDTTATVGFLGDFGFVHYAAHPVIYGAEERRLRGDWPGYLANELNTIVLLGPICGVSPKAEGDSNDTRVKNFVTSGYKKFQAAITSGLRPQSFLDASLKWTEQSVSLSPPVPHPSFAKTYGVPDAFASEIVKRFATPAASVSAFRIGKLAIVGVPGEPSSHIGRRIRDAGRRLGFQSVLVTSHVNGWMGYILDAKDYAQGGYEATLSFNGPAQGEEVERSAIEALRGLALTAAKRDTKD